MPIFNFKGSILGALLALNCIFSNATIIDRGTYLSDSTSGLDWLDVTTTAGRSYNDVSSQLGVGGEFQGWRYATGLEFNGLIKDATNVTPSTDLFQATVTPIAETSALINQLGSTLDTYYFHLVGMSYDDFLQKNGTINVVEKYTYGILSDDATGTNEIRKQLGLIFFYINGNNGAQYIQSAPYTSSLNLDVQDYQYGSYLVRGTRTENIPEPATALLVIAGLFLIRQKQKV